MGPVYLLLFGFCFLPKQVICQCVLSHAHKEVARTYVFLKVRFKGVLQTHNFLDVKVFGGVGVRGKLEAYFHS